MLFRATRRVCLHCVLVQGCKVVKRRNGSSVQYAPLRYHSRPLANNEHPESFANRPAAPALATKSVSGVDTVQTHFDERGRCQETQTPGGEPSAKACLLSRVPAAAGRGRIHRKRIRLTSALSAVAHINK